MTRGRALVAGKVIRRRENRAALHELAATIVKLEEIRRARLVEKIESLPGAVWRASKLEAR